MRDHAPSAEPSIDSSELSAALARLALGQYEERLRGNGFEDWETLTAITEADLLELGFRLGDRRKLQRAIRENSTSSASHLQAARTTRTYRRHPRPDPNAPHKPRTAYVLFGEHVRQDPALSRSSFVEIAKETGRRWRELSDRERVHNWETPAAHRLRDYKEELETYRRTQNYRSYETYLEGFKHGKHDLGLTTPLDSRVLLPSEDQEDIEADPRDSIDTEDLYVEDQPQDMAWAVKLGMEEVRHVLKSLGIHSHSTRVAAMPPEDMTTKAIEAFLYGTGSLLYFWSHDEALNLIRSVYHPQTDSKLVDAIEVFAMSAVGSYCDGEASTTLFQEKFLHSFLYMLSSSSDMCNLRRMRLFACLAICRFTNSTDSARRLVLSALSIGRQAFVSSTFRAETSDEDVRYWWNVFRSIIFLESWCAYNTSHESRVTIQDLTLHYPSRPHAENNLGIFQERVGDLGQLAAYIALDLKTGTQPKAAQARVHFESLNEWHRTLPPPMQLSQHQSAA